MNFFDLPLEELKVYKPELTKEDDFDEFWKKTLEEANKQPLNAKVEKKDYPAQEVEVYDVYYDGFKNSRIYGSYVLPSRRENKPLPALILYHGYNWNSYVISDVFKYTLLGFAVLILDTRGQNVTTPDHNSYPNGGAAGWMTGGILDPEEYYYRYVYMDCVRAVDFLLAREEIDNGRIGVMGGSQGGALSLAVGALKPEVKVVMADVPFLCHFRRAVEVATDGPYNEIVHYFKVHDTLHRTEDRVYKTLSYFDNMNLAPRIKGKALLSVGLEDTICPPSTVFAAYNHLLTKKEIKVYPEYAHGGFSAHEEVKIKFLLKHLR